MKIHSVFILTFLLLIATSNNFSIGSDVQPPSGTSTEDFLNSINVDLPEAEVSCRAGGYLEQIFQKSVKFKSGGNAFFVDKATKEIAQFERAVVTDKKHPGESITLDLFIKVPNVSKENLTSLLLEKDLVVTNNANIIFVIKVSNAQGTETYIFDGKDENGEHINSVIYTQIKKLKTITFNGEKFFTGDGFIKIRFPVPAKKIDADGNLSDAFGGGPGTLNCTCVGCPIHDFDLSDLKDAFDQGLVNDITNEAVNSSQPEP